MKIRLDQYLVQHGMIQSRERAKALIMAILISGFCFGLYYAYIGSDHMPGMDESSI